MFTSTRSDILDIIKAGVELPPGVILFEDPPIHTHAPRASCPGCSPRGGWPRSRTRSAQYCVGCLDPLVGSDGFDIIAELASMLPMRVIGMLLGIPEQDQVAVRNKTDDEPAHRAGQADGRSSRRTIASGDDVRGLHRLAGRAPLRRPHDPAAQRRVRGRDTARPRTLTRQEVLTYTAVLAGAGNETTGRLIGWLAKVLAEHPDQRREVVEDRSLIPEVIDETLRFEPTGPRHRPLRHARTSSTTAPPSRPAARSCCSIGVGQPRPAPLRRTPTCSTSTATDIQHLTFGFGLHFCLGANLARLEGRVALDELLNRFPEWDVDYDGIELAPTSTVRGLGAHAAPDPLNQGSDRTSWGTPEQRASDRAGETVKEKDTARPSRPFGVRTG